MSSYTPGGDWPPQPSFPPPGYGQGYPPPPGPPEPSRGGARTVLWISLGAAVLVAAVTAVVVLAGQGSDDNPTASTAAPPTAVQTMSIAEQDATFYRWVNRHPWSQNGNTEDDWTGLASAMCGAFDRDAAYDDVATILVDDLDDFSTADAHDFVGKSVEIYCPEHTGKVQ